MNNRPKYFKIETLINVANKSPIFLGLAMDEFRLKCLLLGYSPFQKDAAFSKGRSENSTEACSDALLKQHPFLLNVNIPEKEADKNIWIKFDLPKLKQKHRDSLEVSSIDKLNKRPIHFIKHTSVKKNKECVTP